MKNRGITLIALVITIIVLLILAAVSVATLTGNNGILTRAQEAREATEKAEIEEQIRLAQLSAKLKKQGGAITIEDLLEELRKAGVEFDAEDGETGKTSITIGGKYVYEVEETGGGDVTYEDGGTVSKPKPKIVTLDIIEKTNETITVKVTTLRNEKGKLKYYIKEENETEYTFVVEQEEGEYIFEIDPSKTYSKIKVEAIAENGETTSKEIDIVNIPTLTESNLTITYQVNGKTIQETDWTQGPKTVTVSVEIQEYTLQTSQDGQTWKTAETANQTASTTTEITSRAASRSTKQTSTQTFENNGTLYARLLDKTTGQTGKEYTKKIDHIDTLPPNDFTPTATSTTNSITLTGSTTDGESGIAKYYYSKDDGTTWEPTEGTTETSYTFENLTQNRSYSLKMKAVDNVGRETITKPITQTTEKVPDLINKEDDLIKGNTTFTYSETGFTNDNVIVEIKTEIEGYTIQYSTFKHNGYDVWEDYTEPIEMGQNGYIYARLRDDKWNVGSYATANVANIDKTAPTISTTTPLTAESATTNSIGLKIKVTDNNSGLSKIKWFYKKSMDTDYTSTEDVYQAMNGATAGATTEQEKTKTLTGLTASDSKTTVTYNIYAEIYDVAGNMTRSPATGTVDKVTGIVPGGEANIGFSYRNTNWTNENVYVNIENKSGNTAYKLQYSRDGGETWEDWNASVGRLGLEFTENGSVMARLTDNKTAGQTGNVGATATGNVANIDTVKPMISTTLPLKASSATTNSITLQIQVQDKKKDDASKTETVSGLGQIKWYYKEESSDDWLEATSTYGGMGGPDAGSTEKETKTTTLSNLKTGTTYNIYAEVYDVAGNIARSPETGTISKKTLSTYTITYNANGGSGAPSSQTKTEGKSLRLDSTIPTRSGYKFNGWTTNSSTYETLYAPGEKYSSNKNLNLYAIWSTYNDIVVLSGNPYYKTVSVDDGSTGNAKVWFNQYICKFVMPSDGAIVCNNTWEPSQGTEYRLEVSNNGSDKYSRFSGR